MLYELDGKTPLSINLAHGLDVYYFLLRLFRNDDRLPALNWSLQLRPLDVLHRELSRSGRYYEKDKYAHYIADELATQVTDALSKIKISRDIDTSEDSGGFNIKISGDSVADSKELSEAISNANNYEDIRSHIFHSISSVHNRDDFWPLLLKSVFKLGGGKARHPELLEDFNDIPGQLGFQSNISVNDISDKILKTIFLSEFLGEAIASHLRDATHFTTIRVDGIEITFSSTNKPGQIILTRKQSKNTMYSRVYYEAEHYDHTLSTGSILVCSDNGFNKKLLEGMIKIKRKFDVVNISGWDSIKSKAAYDALLQSN